MVVRSHGIVEPWTILRHFGSMFDSSLNTEIYRSVLKFSRGQKGGQFRGRTEPIKEGLSSLKEDGWSHVLALLATPSSSILSDAAL
ncbi:hypothetical protein TNCV_1104251 [Trichonephila clavipes]|nr:hypothetical protein TNCV_1104251 [Trichonephila clavipes]